MTKKWTKDRVERSTANLKNAVRTELIRSGNVQCRIEPEWLNRLYVIADKRKMRISSLVREWLIERISQELESRSVSSYINDADAALHVREPVGSPKLLFEPREIQATGRQIRDPLVHAAIVQINDELRMLRDELSSLRHHLEGEQPLGKESSVRKKSKRSGSR